MKKFLLLPVLLSAIILPAYCQPAKIAIGTASTGSAEIMLKLVARIQSYNPRTHNKLDFYDTSINSPKSALILEKTVNGKTIKKLYINNLEGGTTSIYDITDTFKKIGEIRHNFSRKDSGLFKETNFPGYSFKLRKAHPNIFTGKPVEMCLSNNNKYLWVPYYRRDYDPLATEPSAIALIDVDSMIKLYAFFRLLLCPKW